MIIALALLGLLAIFFAVSLRLIPADPPHIAVVIFLGQRLRKIKREGYRLFPFYPVLYNAILIDMTKKNQDLPPQMVRTGDLAELDISVSLTWTPNEEHAIEYLNNGGEAGVRNILADIVREKLRQWAVSVERGPRNWEEALKARDEVAATLIKDIAGLSDSVWEGIILNIRSGNGKAPIPYLGITLNRLNIVEIRPRGELARTAERFVKEQQDLKGVNLVVEQAIETMKRLGFSQKEAIELSQTERGIVPKKILEIKGDASDELIRAVENIVEKIWKKK